MTKIDFDPETTGLEDARIALDELLRSTIQLQNNVREVFGHEVALYEKLGHLIGRTVSIQTYLKNPERTRIERQYINLCGK